jgi:hypothetical protein
MWLGDHPAKRCQYVGSATSAGAKNYETAWTWLHNRAMVRPGRDLLTGRVEVDECYVGGVEEGLPGRLNLKKALVVVAAQEDGPGIGLPMRRRTAIRRWQTRSRPTLREIPGLHVHAERAVALALAAMLLA